MNIKKIVAIGSIVTAFTSLIFAIPAFAQVGVNVQGGPRGQGGRMGMMRPGVFGTVTAVNGDTVTVTGQQGFGSTSPQTTFTVDATNAVVTKNNTTSTLPSVAVGDKIFAVGTVSGTNVAATMIRDGVMMGMRGRGPGGTGAPGQNKGGWAGATSTPIQGNGQPVVAGTVSAISGNQLTVTTKSNVTYSVDSTNAKFVIGNNTQAALSNVAVGDTVIVQGTINGTSVTASTVIDQTSKSAGGSNPPAHPGFFGGIGQFFMHLFGF